MGQYADPSLYAEFQWDSCSCIEALNQPQITIREPERVVSKANDELSRFQDEWKNGWSSTLLKQRHASHVYEVSIQQRWKGLQLIRCSHNG